MRLALRTFVGTLAIVGVALTAVLISARVAARRAAAASAERGLEQAADLVAQFLAGRTRSLAGGARVFVQGPYFRTLVAERRRDDILDQTFEAAEQLDASWVFITDANGVLVAKSDEPSASGDAMSGIPLVAGALRGQVTTGFGASGDSLLFLATAVPITAPGGAAFGVLVATSRLDSALAADVALATGSQLVFYLRNADGAPRIAAATVPLDTADRRTLEAQLAGRVAAPLSGSAAGRVAPLTLTLGRSGWHLYSSALNTAGGSEVGGYLVMRPVEETAAGDAWLVPSVALGGALALVLAIGAAVHTKVTVARPLRRTADAMLQLADGVVPDRLPMTGRAPEVHGLHDALAALDVTVRDRTHLASFLLATPPVERATEPAIDPPRGRARAVDGTLAFPASRHHEAGPLTLEAGDALAHRFRILARAGAGASGVVYRAIDRARGEELALKVLRPELVPDDAGDRSRRIAAFLATGRAAPAPLALVHEVGEVLGTMCISREWVVGTTLRDLFAAFGPLPVASVLSLARQLLRAVAALHDAHRVHGNLKPANVVITPSGMVRLLDAGLVTILAPGESTSAGHGRPRVTGDGALRSARTSQVSGRLVGATIGTPEYMAPEQLIGAAPSFAGDLYTVGILLSEALHGAVPDGGGSALDGLTSRLRQTPGLGTPIPPSGRPAGGSAGDPMADPPGNFHSHSRPEERAGVSARVLDRLLDALLAPDPADRPPSARQLLAALSEERLTAPHAAGPAPDSPRTSPETPIEDMPGGAATMAASPDSLRLE